MGVRKKRYTCRKIERKKEMEEYLIVTRHKPVVDFFRSIGIEGEVMPVVRAKDVKDKIICGCNIPAHIMSFAKGALVLNIRNETDKPFDELTVEDIMNGFYQLREYTVDSKLCKVTRKKL